MFCCVRFLFCQLQVVVFVLLRIVFCECQLYVCMFNKVVLEKKKKGGTLSNDDDHGSENVGEKENLSKYVHVLHETSQGGSRPSRAVDVKEMY